MDLLDLARSAIHGNAQATTTATDVSPHRGWRITRANGSAIDVLFAPAVTSGELLGMYPGAKLEPIPAPFRRMATPTEAAELRALIEEVLADATDDERAEAMSVARNDVDAALLSLRALRDEQRENRKWRDFQPAPRAQEGAI